MTHVAHVHIDYKRAQLHATTSAGWADQYLVAGVLIVVEGGMSLHITGTKEGKGLIGNISGGGSLNGLHFYGTPTEIVEAIEIAAYALITKQLVSMP